MGQGGEDYSGDDDEIALDVEHIMGSSSADDAASTAGYFQMADKPFFDHCTIRLKPR